MEHPIKRLLLLISEPFVWIIILVELAQVECNYVLYMMINVIYALFTKCEVKMAGYWPSSFLAYFYPAWKVLYEEAKARGISRVGLSRHFRLQLSSYSSYRVGYAFLVRVKVKHVKNGWGMKTNETILQSYRTSSRNRTTGNTLFLHGQREQLGMGKICRSCAVEHSIRTRDYFISPVHETGH